MEERQQTDIMEQLLSDLAIPLIIVIFTHFIGAVSGFGSSMLALPALVLVLGPGHLPTIVAALLLMGLVQALQMTWYTWRHADRRELFKMVGWMAVGMPLGALFLRHVPSGPVVLALALILITSGAFCLLPLRPARWRSWGTLGPVILVGAGAVHGAFASGGMVLSAYAQHALAEKNRFRGTLSVMWALVNVLLFGFMLQGGRISPVAWQLGAAAAPGVICASLLGQRVAARIGQAHFTRLVAVLLILGGIAAAARVLLL